MSGNLINPTWGDDGPQWDIANYTYLSEGVPHEYGGEDISYSDLDLVVISWTDAEDGSTQYATLVGPWDDFDELEDVVEIYFERGTP